MKKRNGQLCKREEIKSPVIWTSFKKKIELRRRMKLLTVRDEQLSQRETSLRRDQNEVRRRQIQEES